MRFQSGFASIYVEKSRVQKIFICFGRAIFNNDIFQFCQFLPYLIVMLGKCTDLIVFGSNSFNQ